MYAPKLDALIHLVDNFSKKHIASPRNGIGFSTSSFKANHFATQEEAFKKIYGENPKNVYKDYLHISEESYSFNTLLKEYVNNDNFLSKWNKLSKKSQKKLVFFDKDSYIILRNKLPSEAIIPINWDLSISSIKWNHSFQETLGLSEDFKLPPNNKTQIFKQTKVLLNMGFSDKKITDIYKNLDNDLMARKIFNLVVKIKDTSIAPLIEKLDGYLHPSQTPLISFVEQQEDLLLNTNKFKM